jgi:hypothetical protein
MASGRTVNNRDRPIRLADVLLAMNKARNEYSYFVDTEGHFHEWFSLKGRLDLRTVSHWELLKSFEDQSESTINFLYDLLK